MCVARLVTPVLPAVRAVRKDSVLQRTDSGHRRRMVANVNSIGFVVRRWIQCSAGKSKNASSSS